MAVVNRILGTSLLTAVLVAGLGLLLIGTVLGRAEPGAYVFFGLPLACVGGVIGAVAGAAQEVVSAQRPKGAPWVDRE